MTKPPFLIRIRLGEIEIELGGEKEEVISTLDQLDEIVDKISCAFSEEINLPEIAITSISKNKNVDEIPKIPQVDQCSQAIEELLSTEWGNTPRSLSELREAMEANAIYFPKTTLSGVLIWMVKKGRLKRWKDKKRGYIYIINKDTAE
jgi:hypothetical protein